MTTVLEEHGEAPTPAEAHDIKYVAFNVYGGEFCIAPCSPDRLT